MAPTIDLSRALSEDALIHLPAKVPLRFGPDGPVIGEATVLRSPDGQLAVTVDRLDGGTHLAEGLLRPISRAGR